MPDEILMDQICLVTGACGFVGSHLVDALVSQGVFVRATDLYNANRQYLPSSEIVEFVPADLTKPEEVRTIVANVSTIFHPAGIFRFNTSRKLLYKVNVEGSTNLFSAALSEDISHIINWSTAMIYGSLDYIPADEKHPIHPEEPYSESKWVQEQIGFSFFEENGLPVSSLRPTAIYGSRSLYGTSQAILALANKKIPGIPGSGKTVQHHVHVKDVVNAAIFISKNQKTIGEAYNIADDEPISIEDSLKIVSEILEIIPPKFHIPRRLVYIYAYFDRIWNKLRRRESLFEKAALKLIFSDHIFDNSKLKELGFSYSITEFRTGIKSTLQWYQDKGYIKK